MACVDLEEQRKPTLRELGINLHLHHNHYLIDKMVVEHQFAQTREEWVLLSDPRVPPSAREWFLNMGLELSEPPSHVIAATKEHKLVGFFRFHMHRNDTELDAAGTWVTWDQRRRGLGLAMWTMALRRFPRVKTIDVVSGTRSGERFLEALKEKGFRV